MAEPTQTRPAPSGSFPTGRLKWALYSLEKSLGKRGSGADFLNRFYLRTEMVPDKGGPTRSLVISASNGSTRMKRIAIPVEESAPDIDIAVPPHFREAVTSMSAEHIYLRSDGKTLTVQHVGSRNATKIPVFGPASGMVDQIIPRDQEIIWGVRIPDVQNFLRGLIAGAETGDNAQKALECIHVKVGGGIATFYTYDGFKAVCVDVSVPDGEEGEFVMHVDTAQDIAMTASERGPALLRWTAQRASGSGRNIDNGCAWNVQGGLIDAGKMPNPVPMIEESLVGSFVIRKKDLSEAIQQAHVCTDSNEKVFTMRVDGDSLLVTSQAQTRGEYRGEIEIRDIEGDPLGTTQNIANVLPLLAACSGEYARISISDRGFFHVSTLDKAQASGMRWRAAASPVRVTEAAEMQEAA